MSHRTTWEDGMMVGVECSQSDKLDADFTLHAEDSDGEDCPVCGVRVRLIWDVRLVEEPPKETTT